MPSARTISAFAAAKANAPAGHVVALAHRREFDADILSARSTQEARRQVAIERDVGISKVANHHKAIFLGQFHDFDKERRINGDRRRIVRVIDNEQLRLGIQMLAGVSDVAQKFVAVGDLERDRMRPRKIHAMHMHRKERRWHNSRIARPEQSE